MKKLVFLLPLLITNFAIAQIPENGLVGYWPFNENANDEINNYNGTISGVVSGTGYKENAYTYDGIDDYILLPKVFSNILDNNFSVSVWFYYEGVNLDDRDYQMIVDFRGEKQFSINIDEVSQKSYVQIYDTGIYKEIYSNQSFTINTWNHLVVLRDNDVIKIYLNNILGDIVSISSLDNTNNENRIGKLYSNVSGGTGHRGTFYGKIDELRIYSVALNSSEITNLYREMVLPESQNAWQTNSNDIFYYNGEGNVGIGTNTPAAKLTVAGPVLATEIKVKTDISEYPDFVFKPEYKIRTIEETEQYIKENGHLPEIPKASEVEEGISLGRMNVMLLQKVEELTLYMIELNKEVKNLNHENENLKVQNENQNIKILELEEKLNTRK